MHKFCIVISSQITEFTFKVRMSEISRTTYDQGYHSQAAEDEVDSSLLVTRAGSANIRRSESIPVRMTKNSRFSNRLDHIREKGQIIS